MPKVSILIPVYNRETFIGECIQSALDQTYRDIEIVIADNASTDRTWEICKQYAARDSRIRLVRNETNIGPVRNWLRCVDEARGHYGKFLFSDDLIFPRFLERVMPFIEDPAVGFVSTAALIGTSKGSGKIAYSFASGDISTDSYFDLLVDAKVPYSPGAAIFRMADIRANLQLSFPTCIARDFTKNGAGPDVLLYALTALGYHHVVMIPSAEVFFRAHAGSFTMADSENEVTKGYGSALSWFFRTKLDQAHWTAYVAHFWLGRVRCARKWVSLRQHCVSNEGSGSLQEVASVLIKAIHVAISKSLKKMLRQS